MMKKVNSSHPQAKEENYNSRDIKKKLIMDDIDKKGPQRDNIESIDSQLRDTKEVETGKIQELDLKDNDPMNIKNDSLDKLESKKTNRGDNDTSIDEKSVKDSKKSFKTKGETEREKWALTPVIRNRSMRKRWTNL